MKTFLIFMVGVGVIGLVWAHDSIQISYRPAPEAAAQVQMPDGMEMHLVPHAICYTWVSDIMLGNTAYVGGISCIPR